MSRAVIAQGLDALGHPPGLAIHTAGYAGIGHYLRNTPKPIVDELHANGVDVWLIDEHTAAESLTGPTQWAGRAHAAVADLQSIGAPAGVAPYATADTNIRPDQFHIVEAGWQAYGPILQAAGYRRGYYAGEDLIDHLLDLGLIDFGWGVGAISWNHGHWSDRVALRQLPQQTTVGGTTCDLNRIFVSDYGQWSAIPIPIPTPTPEPSEEDMYPLVIIDTHDAVWDIDSLHKQKQRVMDVIELGALLESGRKTQVFGAGGNMDILITERYTDVTPTLPPDHSWPTADEIAQAVVDEEARRLSLH